MQAYANKLLFGIGQSKEEAGPSGFIGAKRKHRPPKWTYISSEELSCDETQETRPTKKKERRTLTNIKTFQDTLQKAKQSNLLWKRYAGTGGYTTFSVTNESGDTYQVVTTDTSSCSCPFFQRDKIKATCKHIIASLITGFQSPKPSKFFRKFSLQLESCSISETE